MKVHTDSRCLPAYGAHKNGPKYSDMCHTGRDKLLPSILKLLKYAFVHLFLQLFKL